MNALGSNGEAPHDISHDYHDQKKTYHQKICRLCRGPTELCRRSDTDTIALRQRAQAVGDHYCTHVGETFVPLTEPAMIPNLITPLVDSTGTVSDGQACRIAI